MVIDYLVNPDPGFWWPNKLFKYCWKKLSFLIKNLNLLFPRLDPLKERPSYRRSLLPSTENISTSKNEIYFLPSVFVSHFLPSWIRIRIQGPLWIRIHSGSATRLKGIVAWDEFLTISLYSRYRILGSFSVFGECVKIFQLLMSTL